MNRPTRLRLAPAVGAALSAAALLLSPGIASASITDGEALGICKQKVVATFGEQAIVKLKRIKARGGYIVDVKVSGVADKPFSAKCEVARDGTVSAFTHEGPAK